MVTVALDAQNETPALASAQSSFHEALDSVGRFSCFEIHMSNPCFTGPTLTDFPWDCGIVEKTQRSIDAVSDSMATEPDSRSLDRSRCQVICKLML